MAFIAIEGADGSGKSTQTKLLTEWLKAQGHDVVAFSFPRYGKPSAHFLEKYLKGEYGALESVAPFNASLFFALDRYDAAQAIRQSLAGGQIVVSTRFTGSNMAIQGAKIANADARHHFFRAASDLEYVTLGLPKPDISIVLSLPAQTADRLISERGPGKRRLHESNIRQITGYVNAFEELCDLYPDQFLRLDCTDGGKLLPRDAIQQKLRALIRPFLPAAPRP